MTWRDALDLVLPPRCSACGGPLHHEQAFCFICEDSLLAWSGGCVRCGLPGTDHCRSCRREAPAYSATRAAFLYGGQLAVALQRFKYQGTAQLARPLGLLLRPALQQLPEALLVPVPLHPRRLRERGFNQAGLLAAQALGLAQRRRLAGGALQRIRDTAPQAGLDRRQRHHNLRGAFRAAPGQVAGRRVLLVDDVLTTGATAQACAEALREAGALEVQVLVLARVASP